METRMKVVYDVSSLGLGYADRRTPAGADAAGAGAPTGERARRPGRRPRCPGGHQSVPTGAAAGSPGEAGVRNFRRDGSRRSRLHRPPALTLNSAAL